LKNISSILNANNWRAFFKILKLKGLAKGYGTKDIYYNAGNDL